MRNDVTPYVAAILREARGADEALWVRCYLSSKTLKRWLFDKHCFDVSLYEIRKAIRKLDTDGELHTSRSGGTPSYAWRNEHDRARTKSIHYAKRLVDALNTSIPPASDDDGDRFAWPGGTSVSVNIDTLRELASDNDGVLRAKVLHALSSAIESGIRVTGFESGA